jgi:hypothetical protein
MYQLQKQFRIISIMCLMLMIVACAGNKAMSTKQQGLVMEALYKTTFLEVKAIRENPKATPAQKSMADQKEVILDKVYPVLKDFMAPIIPGDLKGDIVGYGISEEKLTLLFDLIDQLSQLAVKGGTP